MSAPLPSKPTFRGVLHQWFAFAVLGAGLVLVAMAPSTRAKVSAGIYALSLLTLYTVSAVYHRPNWNPKARSWMRRADHASIFVLIAGTYTPLCILALPPDVGTRLLWMVWGGALLGILQSLFWIHAPKPLTALLYVALGWIIVLEFPRVRETVTVLEGVLLGLGGLVYTAGAITYATRRPRLKPGVFGYHELFHALTVLAGFCHFAVVVSVVRRLGA